MVVLVLLTIAEEVEEVLLLGKSAPSIDCLENYYYYYFVLSEDDVF